LFSEFCRPVSGAKVGVACIVVYDFDHIGCVIFITKKKTQNPTAWVYGNDSLTRLVRAEIGLYIATGESSDANASTIKIYFSDNYFRAFQYIIKKLTANIIEKTRI
jgi:hypothetical protein